MNVKQRSTRKALIGQVATLITGTRPLTGGKRPFPGTPTTYVKQIPGQGPREMRFPPEHRPVFNSASTVISGNSPRGKRIRQAHKLAPRIKPWLGGGDTGA